MNLDQPVRARPFRTTDNLPAQSIARKPFWRSVFDFYARHYRLIILGHGVAILYVETVEHLQSLDHPRIYFFSEFTLIILMMVVFTVLTQILLAALNEKSQANNILQLQHELRADLSHSRDTADIAHRLARRIPDMMPAVQSQLFVRATPTGAFVPAMPPSPASDLLLSHPIDPALCQRCLAHDQSHLFPLKDCRQAGLRQPAAASGYCLPLAVGAHPLGLLYLQPSPENPITPAQEHLIENLAPEISSAILLDMEKNIRLEERLASAIHTVNMDLARDLHDTIGQNISYLRMKLDQLSGDEPDPDQNIGRQLLTMRDVANESYDLLRGTLSMLQTEDAADLPHLFSRYAAHITERSAIVIDVVTHGVPTAVSPGPLRQLFYIFREILNNVEKHAHATCVRVDLNWSDDTLELVVSDDGAGFDPFHADLPGHYGLKFMRQRAAEIQGAFTIQSAVGVGTRVIVRVPCA